MKRRLPFVLSMMLVGLISTAYAQRQTGTITGRVVADDGQPVPHAKVSITGVGGIKKMMSGRVQVVTDESGGFLADGLDPAAYKVSATAPGYVQMPEDKTGEQPFASASRFVRVGENVTIRMIRGGVITGRVTNSSGEPVIAISVDAARVRDENGQPVTGETNINELNMSRQTDDRGVYRIYGLAPGSYIVGVGSGAFGFSSRPTPFSGRMKIYYPSATRDTAQEVSISSGEEAGGIDIRYRSERGFSISGKISGAPTGEQGMAAMTPTVITLTKPGTDIIVATTSTLPIGEANSYAFYGLPNGDYEAVATRSNINDLSSLVSSPRRVAINGRDVTGVDLALTPMASISGVVTLEKMSGQKCEAGRESYPDEIVLTPKPEDPKSKAPFKMSFWGNPGTASPDEKGAFSLFGLSAGRHFIEAQLPDEHWFVKTMTLTSAPTTPAGARNAGNNGVMLKAGEKVSGLAVTIAEGAAGLKGKVVAPDNGKLPARLRVHLLPAEPEAKDEMLRFAETKADDDGSFAFANLAPGKYLLVARPIAETESSAKPQNPLAWNSAERIKLRREAEALNVAVELQACQQTTNFILRLGK